MNIQLHDTVDRTNGQRLRWHVTWRDQSHKCHDQTWKVWDSEGLRLWSDERGVPRAYPSQCGSCGSTMVPDVRMWEVK